MRYWTIIWRNVARNPRRALLTAVSIGFSLFLIVMEQIAAGRRLRLEAFSERGYYEAQTAAGSGLRVLASILTVFMGIGACFAAMNTMYAAVAGRAREIGTLRALGFSRAGILASFMAEAVLLALIGGWFPARDAARKTIVDALRSS